MKRNMMFALIALGLGGVSVANAQDFSSWYLAPRIGADLPDSKRTTDTSLFAGIGIGTWVNPNFAVDFEYGMNNADFKDSSLRAGHQWESVQLDVAGRWFFGELGSGWRPYLMGGLGALRHKAYSGFLLADKSYASGGGWDPMATLGVGVQYNLSDRLAFRGELAARYDHDNNTMDQTNLAGFPRHSGFTDGSPPSAWCGTSAGTPSRRPSSVAKSATRRRRPSSVKSRSLRSRLRSTCVASSSSSTTRRLARSWCRR